MLARTAIVLATEHGSGFVSASEDRPKSLIEVDETPILVRLLKQLKAAKIQRAIVVSGFQAYKIQDTLEGLSNIPEILFAYNGDYSETGSAESLRRALSLTRESPFILCEGNLISAEDTIFEHVNSHPKKNILGVDFNIGDHFRQPRIIAQTDGDEATVEAFAEEIPEVEATGQFVGVSKYADPELIRALRKKLDNLSAPRRREAEYEQICAELIEQGFRFHTADIDDSEWIKLKEPKDLEVAENIT